MYVIHFRLNFDFILVMCVPVIHLSDIVVFEIKADIHLLFLALFFLKSGLDVVNVNYY